jgi:uncharacterized protein (TIGR00725 family)
MPVVARNIVALAGPEKASPMTQELAREMGRAVIARGFHLLIGGAGVITQAACEGAQEEKTNLRRRGKLVGDAPVVMSMLAGTDRKDAGNEVDLVLATGLGPSLASVVCSACDALVAVEGGASTLAHVAVAYQLKKPVVLVSATGSVLETLVGEKLDAARDDMIMAAETSERALDMLVERLAGHGAPLPGRRR